MTRRLWTILASLSLLGMLIAPVQAASVTITRVNGGVTDANFKGLDAFLSNSVDAVIGLKLSFPAEDQNRDGTVQAYKDGDLFISYLAGPETETQVSAESGYDFRHGEYVFDGFYLVKYGGIFQGITALALQPVDEAQVILSGAKINDIEIDSLGH